MGGVLLHCPPSALPAAASCAAGLRHCWKCALRGHHPSMASALCTPGYVASPLLRPVQRRPERLAPAHMLRLLRCAVQAVDFGPHSSSCIDVWAPGGGVGTGTIGADSQGPTNYTRVITR